MTGCGRPLPPAPWRLCGPRWLGAQSLSDAIRKPLGRDATRAGVDRFLRDLVALDRGAIVIDLIYGLPGQTPQDVADDVRLCATLGLDGLDLYLLNLIPARRC
ncbi:hypothetical protein [Paracoccus sp. SJTW-4]|uniref:hypothetical protein n=1 Tax=Paracoccus sp. SJTW-4 TaxID=3078428 RepID=UPI0039E9D8A8